MCEYDWGDIPQNSQTMWELLISSIIPVILRRICTADYVCVHVGMQYVCTYVNLATDFYICEVEAYVLCCRHLTQNCYNSSNPPLCWMQPCLSVCATHSTTLS
jgi:hypothetical protein